MIYLKAVGNTSTVAAFTIFGATQESISAMNVNFCTTGMSITTQINAHAPGPNNETTIDRKCKMNALILLKIEIELFLTQLNLPKIGNFPTLLMITPMRPRHRANSISKMKLSSNVSDSSFVMQTYEQIIFQSFIIIFFLLLKLKENLKQLTSPIAFN